MGIGYYLPNLVGDFLMKKKYDLIIPIGNKCKCSFNLRRLRLQYESFPFDWIYIKNPDVIERLLRTDFKVFLLEKNLRLRSKQPRFDEVDDLATGIYSAHDFDTDRSIHECYPAVKAKYDRRIAKLKNKIAEARRILLVHCAEDEILTDAEIVRSFASLRKLLAGKQVDLLYICLPMEKTDYREEKIAENITKITFYRNPAFEWQGEAKLFDRALRNVRLSLLTSLKWYSSKVYLGGLLQKLKRHLLTIVSCLLPSKSQRKAFRAKYLAKKNHFN